MKIIKWLTAVVCVFSMLFASACNMSAESIAADETAVKKINLGDMEVSATLEGDRLSKISFDDIDKLVADAVAKAEQMYEEYDEIVVPAYAYSNLGDTVITKSQFEIDADASDWERSVQALQEYHQKKDDIGKIAIFLIRQIVSEERCALQAAIYGEEASSINNDTPFCTMYCYLDCDTVEQVQSKIALHEFPSQMLVWNTYGSEIVSVDANGERKVLFPTGQLKEEGDAILTAYEAAFDIAFADEIAALEAEKGETE